MPLTILNRCSMLALLVGMPLLLGCGGGVAGPKTAKVTGVVTYKGQPVAGATVTFTASEKSPRTRRKDGRQGGIHPRNVWEKRWGHFGRSHCDGDEASGGGFKNPNEARRLYEDHVGRSGRQRQTCAARLGHQE